MHTTRFEDLRASPQRRSSSDWRRTHFVHANGDFAIEARQSRGMDISRPSTDAADGRFGGQRLEAVATDDTRAKQAAGQGSDVMPALRQQSADAMDRALGGRS